MIIIHNHDTQDNHQGFTTHRGLFPCCKHLRSPWYLSKVRNVNTINFKYRRESDVGDHYDHHHHDNSHDHHDHHH